MCVSCSARSGGVPQGLGLAPLSGALASGLPFVILRPPSDASSWSTSSHSGLDCRLQSAVLYQRHNLPIRHHKPLSPVSAPWSLLCSDQLGTQANWTLGSWIWPHLCPLLTNALFLHALLPATPLRHLPSRPPEAVRLCRAAGAGSSPRKRAVKLQFLPDEQQSSESKSSCFFLPLFRAVRVLC